MATGNTTTGTLSDSLPTLINSARAKREYEGHMPNLVDKQTLPEGQGLTWSEIAIEQLEAQANITENTVLENPQQFADTLFSLTPLVAGINTLVTDRVYRRVDKKAIAKMGGRAQDAMQRLKDKDGLAVLDGASIELGGAGTTLTSGHISAAMARVKRGEGNEPSNGPWYIVLHSFQIKDIQDELVSGIGTYNLEGGDSQKTFRKGFSGTLFDGQVFADDNIEADSSDDAKGGAFAKEAIVMVQGHSPRSETKRRPEVGGGADEMFMYDEYVYGERSAGNWLVEIQSDVTSPTS